MPLILRPLRYISFDGSTLSVLDPQSGTELRWPAIVLSKRELNGGSRIIAVGKEAVDRATDGASLVQPFAHPRLVVHQFYEAVALVRAALVRSTQRFTFRKPILVLHPLREFPAGLTDIEERALLELGGAAGGGRVHIHLGSPPSREMLLARTCT